MQRLEALLADAKRILDQADRVKQYRAALTGIREMVRIKTLLLQVRCELDRHPQINLVLSVQWVTLRTAILLALEPYPDARAAIVKVLADASQG